MSPKVFTQAPDKSLVSVPPHEHIDPSDHCFFLGQLEDGGRAAMSACNDQLDGLIETPHGRYGIQPFPSVRLDNDWSIARPRDAHSDFFDHMVYRLEDATDPEDNHACGASNLPNDHPFR